MMEGGATENITGFDSKELAFFTSKVVQYPPQNCTKPKEQLAGGRGGSHRRAQVFAGLQSNSQTKEGHIT